MKSIVIIIDYFGTFPKFFPFFLESCRWNPTINWIIHTDCAYIGNIPENVELKIIPWQDYKDYVSIKLGIHFNPDVAYKICDLKPAYGDLWNHEIINYDF